MINKLDTTFTSTSKGLMWLFTIGLIHTVLGTSILGNEIAIPTLPVIRIEHPNFIYYLYWALVVYSIYRYCLHKKSTFRELNVNSMVWGLQNSPLGKNFIIHHITADIHNTYAQKGKIPLVKATGSNACLFYLEDYNDSNAAFMLEYNTSIFPMSAHYSSSYYVQGVFSKTDNWGDWFPNDIEEMTDDYSIIEQYESSSLHSIQNRKIKYKLILINSFFSLVWIFKDRSYFDALLPVTLNVMLFIHHIFNTKLNISIISLISHLSIPSIMPFLSGFLLATIIYKCLK